MIEPLLSDAEHQVVRQAGDLWGALCAVIPEGPTRAADLHELIAHVHAIQHTIMANAAARAYPETYRTLGGSLSVGERAAPLADRDPDVCGDQA